MQKDVRHAEEFFLKRYKEKFFSAVKWNMVESIGYQAIFMLHQSALFLYCDRNLYGKVGALLAACYLGVTLLVGGFDGGLLPFFERITSTKQSFKKFIFGPFSRHMVLVGVVIALICNALFFASVSFFSLTGLQFFLVGMFVFIETLKKILKQFLYLGFQNKQTALFEVIQISLYVATVWAGYAMGLSFSIALFLIPFISYSALFCIFCGSKLKDYYQTLPLGRSDLFHASFFFSFGFLRIMVLVNQLSRSFFSSNFLVPLFAIHGGFREAGVLTFANYLTHACTFFIQKITLPPAEALFSRIKKLSLVTHYKAFSLVLSLFSSLTFLFGFLFFLKGRSLAISLGCATLDQVTWRLITFFFFIHLLESVFMVYEKFFLLREKIKLLALGNMITCTLCYIISLFDISFLLLIFSCIFIRFSFFIFLSLLIYSSKVAPSRPFEDIR